MKNKHTIFLWIFAALFLFGAEHTSAQTVPADDYRSEGVVFHAFSDLQPSSTPVYRFWNDAAGDHFYTTDETKRQELINNSAWVDEGIAFYAFSEQQVGTKPVHVFEFVNDGNHFYTMSNKDFSGINQAAQNRNDIVYLGVAFYAYDTIRSNTNPVYRLVSSSIKDHFYTIDESERDIYLRVETSEEEEEESEEEENEGEEQSQQTDTVPVYRFWNDAEGDHFYTINQTKRQELINDATWADEGIAFYAFSEQKPGTTPVHYFEFTNDGNHYYTMDRKASSWLKEAARSRSDIVDLGVAFYAYPSAQADTLPVYRLVSSAIKDHFYTIDDAERCEGDFWRFEEDAWWVPTTPASAITPAQDVCALNDSEGDSNTNTGDTPMPVYRFWNSAAGDHFYTIDPAKRQELINASQWADEGIAFYAFSEQKPGTAPVYYFEFTNDGNHYYTMDPEASAWLKNAARSRSDIVDLGTAFYAYSSAQSDTTPVFRLVSSAIKDHFYTIDAAERCEGSFWRFEANAWWVPNTPANALTPAQDVCELESLGPNIRVGLWSNDRDTLRNNPFKIEANKNYVVKRANGSIIATVTNDTTTRVTYDSDGHLEVYGDETPRTRVDQEVFFEAADGNSENMVFDIHRPDSPYDRYRGTIKVRYSDVSKRIWMINQLPLEHYVWGDGEIRGTGDMDYNRVMTTAYRSYGYWKILYSTRYASEGFHVDGTPGNQIYYGYDREQFYPRVSEAARSTMGMIVKHGDDIALTPYSSWTDGRTRSFQERWGSTLYPWCQSVPDPYGKHPSKGTSQLVSEGNHMVGISAHGALSLAGDYGWDWDDILRYYLTNVTIEKIY